MGQVGFLFVLVGKASSLNRLCEDNRYHIELRYSGDRVRIIRLPVMKLSKATLVLSKQSNVQLLGLILPERSLNNSSPFSLAAYMTFFLSEITTGLLCLSENNLRC